MSSIFIVLLTTAGVVGDLSGRNSIDSACRDTSEGRGYVFRQVENNFIYAIACATGNQGCSFPAPSYELVNCFWVDAVEEKRQVPGHWQEGSK